MTQKYVPIQKLTSQAIDQFDKTNLSILCRYAYRIATLAGDADFSWRFAHDLRPSGGSRTLNHMEVEKLLSEAEEQERIKWHAKVREIWIDERTVRISPDFQTLFGGQEEMCLIGSIDELERDCRHFEMLENTETGALEKAGYHYRSNLNHEILSRIKARVFEYLISKELENSTQNGVSAIFNISANIVIKNLELSAPEILGKFNLAFSKLIDGDVESYSHALTTCRRVIVLVADIVHPAENKISIDDQGSSHKLGEKEYLNRLTEFLKTQKQNSNLRASIIKTLEDLDSRIRSLNDLSAKGVHDAVTQHEVSWCVSQTFLTVGEILNLFTQLYLPGESQP